MEPDSSSASRFRFRDHNREIEDGDLTEGGDTSSDSSYLSTDDNEVESELDSMTGKGIKRLCSELLELKQASDEEFQKNVIFNFSSFIRIFEEMGVIENEVLELKHYVTTQRKLVKDLIDGIYLKILSEETVNLDSEEPLSDEPPSTSILKNHTEDVSEVLDILLSEHRLDEALLIFEMEAERSQSMQFWKDRLPDVWVPYKSAISERKAMLIDQLTLEAENPRASAAELQKALAGLCRLGVNHLATPLLLRYYHSRIASGIHGLQYSTTFSQGAYISEVAKLVFSMISQAARSFLVLYGETSSYASEFENWACEETAVFALCFNKYVKSILEITGGLSAAVEALNFAVSYCSLLETQKMVLRPCLIRHILPCMEEVLQIHTDHFKKVIRIFTSMDTWVVGRYLVSGIITEGSSPMAVEQQPEYCLLTNSGRKFVTLLQAITEDISSLVSIQMEGSILKTLMNLFSEYSIMLERALIKGTKNAEKSGSKINLTESLAQKVSIIANLATLVHFLSSIIRNVFKDIDHLKFEIDSYILAVQDTSSRLRAHFCEQFIHETISLEDDQRLNPAGCIEEEGDSLMPSVSYQVLFLELRKVEKLAEDSIVEVDWLKGLQTELVESIFDWISTSNKIWMITDEDSAVHQHGKFMQFSIDIQFLVEIARCGGYLTNKMIDASQDLISRMKLALVSVGLDINRYVIYNARATNAAVLSLQKLKDEEETKSFSDETFDDDLEEAIDNYSTHSASDSIEDDDGNDRAESSVDIDELEVASSDGADISKLEAGPTEGHDAFEENGAVGEL